MSKADPKHGRWILPLVILGLVFFTVVFVNSLPAADPDEDSATGTTTVENGDSGDGATTTTTATSPDPTLPPTVATFMGEVDQVGVTARGLAVDARTINEDWDARAAGLSEIKAELDRIQEATGALADEVTELQPPAILSTEWDGVLDATEDLRNGAVDMITGINSSDDGSIRRNALASFEAAADSLNTALDALEEAAQATAG